MRLPAMWVKLWFLPACLFLSFSLAAPPEQGTLGAQLALEQTPGLDITLQKSDATTASYTVSTPKNVLAVAEAVRAYLVGSGWLSHPSVSEAPKPKPGVVQRLESFVRESGLLELRAAKVVEQDEVTLELTLISLEAPQQVAAAP